MRDLHTDRRYTDAIKSKTSRSATSEAVNKWRNDLTELWFMAVNDLRYLVYTEQWDEVSKKRFWRRIKDKFEAGASAAIKSLERSIKEELDRHDAYWEVLSEDDKRIERVEKGDAG